MKQKDYQKPTMKVVKMRHRSQILAGSPQGGQGSLRNYNWDDDIDEE